MSRKKGRLVAITAVIIKTLLLVCTTVIFLFALFSGSEKYGGGIVGIVKNAPNTLPWLLLYAIIFVLWKWELTGGIILSVFSLILFFFFHIYQFHDTGAFIVFFSIVLPLFIFGIFFIYYHYWKKRGAAPHE